jgi:hypothetical protein
MENSIADFPMNFRVKPLNAGNQEENPISKTKQVVYAKTVFDELELVMEITTSSKTPH